MPDIATNNSKLFYAITTITKSLSNTPKYMKWTGVMSRAALTAASVFLDTFLSCPVGAMKLIALGKVIF